MRSCRVPCAAAAAAAAAASPSTSSPPEPLGGTLVLALVLATWPGSPWAATVPRMRATRDCGLDWAPGASTPRPPLAPAPALAPARARADAIRPDIGPMGDCSASGPRDEAGKAAGAEPTPLEPTLLPTPTGDSTDTSLTARFSTRCMVADPTRATTRCTVLSLPAAAMGDSRSWDAEADSDVDAPAGPGGSRARPGDARWELRGRSRADMDCSPLGLVPERGRLECAPYPAEAAASAPAEETAAAGSDRAEGRVAPLLPGRDVATPERGRDVKTGDDDTALPGAGTQRQHALHSRACMWWRAHAA